MPSRSSIQEGETITVKGDENIYAVAREHNVSMRDLIVLNNLKPPYEIRAGQSLQLPAGDSSFAGDLKAPAPAPLAAVESNQLAPIEPASVSSQALEPLPPPQFVSTPVAPASKPAAMVLPPPPETRALAAPTSLTQAEPVPALNRPSPQPKPVATTMEAPAATADTMPDTVWPVQGPVLSAFGAKGPGLNNDGVNIGAPKGAPVVAAAAGTVVYAGNEMKGFGNLVLIRHQGDWVTAYAHLDRVLVKKDMVVGQGDMIGTVGKTGNVATPQLHFETRHNGKPVDPTGFVKGNM